MKSHSPEKNSFSALFEKITSYMNSYQQYTFAYEENKNQAMRKTREIEKARLHNFSMHTHLISTARNLSYIELMAALEQLKPLSSPEMVFSKSIHQGFPENVEGKNIFEEILLNLFLTEEEINQVFDKLLYSLKYDEYSDKIFEPRFIAIILNDKRLFLFLVSQYIYQIKCNFGISQSVEDMLLQKLLEKKDATLIEEVLYTLSTYSLYPKKTMTFAFQWVESARTPQEVILIYSRTQCFHLRDKTMDKDLHYFLLKVAKQKIIALELENAQKHTVSDDKQTNLLKFLDMSNSPLRFFHKTTSRCIYDKIHKSYPKAVKKHQHRNEKIQRAFNLRY